MIENEDRKLSDADIEAILNQVEQRVAARFYSDLGRGVWGMVRKALLLAMVAVAAYGSVKGYK